MIFIVLYIKLLAVESFPDIINTQVDFSMFHVTCDMKSVRNIADIISGNIFKNPNQLAGFNFIHGLRLTNVTEILSDSNFMDCLVGFHFLDSIKLIGCFISAKETQLRQM